MTKRQLEREIERLEQTMEPETETETETTSIEDTDGPSPSVTFTVNAETDDAVASLQAVRDAADETREALEALQETLGMAEDDNE